MSNKTLLDDEAFLMAVEMGCVRWHASKIHSYMLGDIDVSEQYWRLPVVREMGGDVVITTEEWDRRRAEKNK